MKTNPVPTPAEEKALLANALKKGDMVMMESLRNFSLTTTKGHSVRFQSRTPRPVPRAIVQEAMAAGCVPTDANEVPFLDDQSKAKVEFDKPLRRAVLFIAVDSLVQENDTKKFDGGGAPRIEVIEEMTGIQVNKKEIGQILNEYRSCKQLGNDLPTHPNAEAVYEVVQAENKNDLIDIAKKMGYPPDKCEGLSTKELRRMMLAKHVIASAG